MLRGGTEMREMLRGIGLPLDELVWCIPFQGFSVKDSAYMGNISTGLLLLFLMGIKRQGGGLFNIPSQVLMDQKYGCNHR